MKNMPFLIFWFWYQQQYLNYFSTMQHFLCLLMLLCTKTTGPKSAQLLLDSLFPCGGKKDYQTEDCVNFFCLCHFG